MARTAYVVEAYVPRGGTYMAYQVARILHEEFRYDVRVLTAGDASRDHSHGMFEYETVFPCAALADCETLIRDDDVLVCNPSFSDLNLGSRVRGFKIMYCQGFTTYRMPDLFFDHYVAVSGFVAGFLRQTYKLDATVIPAFLCVPADCRNAATPWEKRPPGSVALHVKGDPVMRSQQKRLLQKLRGLLAKRDRDLEAAIDWTCFLQDSEGFLPHERFLERLSSVRYLISLSFAEGFGLVPLEAMALGTVVVGFDGYGGREYMVPGVNCEVAEYPDLHGLAECVVAAMRNEPHAKRLAAAGLITSEPYTYDSFRNAWVADLARVLPR